jgi:hypothetical protein
VIPSVLTLDNTEGGGPRVGAARGGGELHVKEAGSAIRVHVRGRRRQC